MPKVGNLGGIERAEPPAGSGADVNQAAAFAKRLGHEIDGFRDLGQSLSDGGCNCLVFSIDSTRDFQSVISSRCRVLGFAARLRASRGRL